MSERLTPDPELEALVQQLNSGTRPSASAAAAGGRESYAEEARWESDGAEPGGAVAWEQSLRWESATWGRGEREEHAPLVAAGASLVGSGEPLERLLVEAVRRSASDLLLVPGAAPTVRVDGRLTKVEGEELGAEAVGELLAPHLSAPQRRLLRDDGSIDLTLRLAAEAGAGWRFRVNLHRQRGRLAAALRALPRRIPSLDELALPGTLTSLVTPTRGLVLVCGPTGAGKTTTLAALVDHINRTRAAHVITIEQPIEYEHGSRQCLVEQVEVGSDAPSFAAALRAALRQDPDVILVGEMRDLETMSIALTAAETGHLILATLHTNDVVQAVHRIVDVFPADQQAQIRQQLALALHAVVVQQLVPRRDRPGRVVALEVLTATYAVRSHIRNAHMHKLYNEVTLGKRHGMVALEESLARLVREGVVAEEEARMRSGRPDELESLLRGAMRGGG